MRVRGTLITILILKLVFGTIPAAAQDRVCLRAQQIDNWEIVDDKTLIVTDRLDRQYRLGLIGNCIGLQQTRFSLGFETFSELICIRPGDSIQYNDLTFGAERCTISSIESYTSEDQETGENRQDEG